MLESIADENAMLGRASACTVLPPEQHLAAAPFLKWAGGKAQLLGQYASLFPSAFGEYYEPFMGGAAVFFHLKPRSAHLSDLNEELVNAFVVVRDNVEELITDLSTHALSHDYYYAIRATHPGVLSPIQRASRLIYLNKTCYNGLYRVNRAGAFNVPYGRYKNPNIVNADGLRRASEALQGATVEALDFRDSVVTAKPGDFVYFDPPYQPLSKTASFTGYVGDGFGEDAQERLARVVRELATRGVLVMLSNSDTPLVRELYSGFRTTIVAAKRAISCKGDRRGTISELVIRNYGD